eukprot:gene11884-12028_t
MVLFVCLLSCLAKQARTYFDSADYQLKRQANPSIVDGRGNGEASNPKAVAAGWTLVAAYAGNKRGAGAPEGGPLTKDDTASALNAGQLQDTIKLPLQQLLM